MFLWKVSLCFVFFITYNFKFDIIIISLKKKKKHYYSIKQGSFDKSPPDFLHLNSWAECHKHQKYTFEIYWNA